MYHFIEDKDFLKKLRSTCSNIVNQLVQRINNDSVMTVEAHLVGSGARKLETQNSNEPVDLDYNLNILNTHEIDINDCRKIKEYVRKQFNIILNNNGWEDCQDSTSVLSTKYHYFTNGNQTLFKIDLAIVVESQKGWFRLIHDKTGFVALDRYFWNEAPHSKGLASKVDKIKSCGLWGSVRETYLDKKNMYLKRQDKFHPSFNCYIEAVNQVFSQNF